VRITDGTRDCIISTKNGMAIRFSEEQVRVMGRTARGVTAIHLDEGDEVVNLVTVAHEEPSPEDASEGSAEGDSGEGETARLEAGAAALLTACENGYGKRTPVSAYRCQKRAGKGVIDIKTQDRNGPVVGTCRVHEGDEVMIITNAGKIIRTPVDTISLIGRNTMGVRLMNLEEGEKVAAVARIAESSVGVEEGKEDVVVGEMDDDASGKRVH
jgi:DNA gyrase subunit A